MRERRLDCDLLIRREKDSVAHSFAKVVTNVGRVRCQRGVEVRIFRLCAIHCIRTYCEKRGKWRGEGLTKVPWGWVLIIGIIELRWEVDVWVVWCLVPWNTVSVGIHVPCQGASGMGKGDRC